MSEDIPITCPKCGSHGKFSPVEMQQGNSGFLMLLLGGLLPYLLYQSSHSNMVVCENCHFVFRPSSGRLVSSRMWMILLGMALIGVIIIVLRQL